MSGKKKEQKFRRALNNAGYSLHKSTKRNIYADDLGGYMITIDSINGVAAGSRFELSLYDVADFVAAYC